MPEINGINVPFMPIGGADALKDRAKISDPGKARSGKFDEIFQEELNKVKFSGHAIDRLESRDIKLDKTQLDRLNKAIDTAEKKGSKDALILMEEQSFIVSVQNKTVITVLDNSTMDDNFIGNIDSAVLVK